MIIFGNKTDFKFVQKTNTSYIISWGYTPMKTVETITKRNTIFETGNIIESQTEGSWESIEINCTGVLPKALAQLKVNEYINSKTSIAINNFKWKNYNVGLSEKDQLNYTALYNLISTGNIDVLPFSSKFNENSTVVYYEFSTVEDYTDFYKSMVKHIHTCLQNGWGEKNSINWDNYKI